MAKSMDSPRSEARPTLSRRLQGWLDLGIPAGEVSSERMRHIRTISGVTFAMIWIALLTIGQSWVVGKWEVMAYLGVATAAGVANLFLLRATRSAQLAGHVALAILAALVTASSLSSGGFYNPGFGWFYVLPLAAAVALDVRGAAFWTLVTAALTVGFWILPELGVHLPDQTPPELRQANALAARLLTVTALGAIGVGFMIGQQRSANELERETTYLELVMHAAVSANQARSFEEALDDALERICQSMGWVAGHALEVDDDGASRSMGLFHSALAESNPLEQVSLSRKFPRGVGLPGRVVASGEPEIVTRETWVMPREPGATRERGLAAHALGLAAAFAIPIFVHGRVRAVIEFASPKPLPDAERLLEVFTHIGVELGRVAERTAFQERIRQTQKMEAVGQLAAGLAHEINNPMSFVRSNLHTLRQMNLDEKDKRDPAEFGDLIDESLDGVERTISIVRDVMQFSRAGGAGPSEWQPADVNELLRDSLRVASSDVPARIDFHLDTGDLPSLRCAPNGLRQVFLNLIVNAVQAVGESGHIQMRTRHEGDHVVVRIEDDGPGMTASDREKLFDPFFTTKPVGEGTGLGLTVSYEIVQGHGGTIAAESEPGAGAVFEVRLPLDRA
ncbi:MAG: ATP-binding protein [Myxococcota bacterium]